MQETSKWLFGAVLLFAFGLSGCSDILPTLKSSIGVAVGDITVDVQIKKGDTVIKQYVCGYDYQLEVPVNCKEVSKG